MVFIFKGLGIAKNKVSFQKGISLGTFLKAYGTQEQCFNALLSHRKKGISAMEPHGYLGISYNATWRMRHKLMQERYLAEFQYRFNRRYYVLDLVARLAYVALRIPHMPERLLKISLV